MPIVEASGSPRSTTPAQSEAEDIVSPDPFSGGKKVRKKNDKSEAVLELMVQGLQIKELELEQKKKDRKEDREMLLRAEQREERLIDYMELLVKHIVRE